MLVIVTDLEGKKHVAQTVEVLKQLASYGIQDVIMVSDYDDELVLDILAVECIFNLVFIHDGVDQVKEELLQAISYVFSELHDIRWNITIVRQFSGELFNI